MALATKPPLVEIVAEPEPEPEPDERLLYLVGIEELMNAALEDDLAKAEFLVGQPLVKPGKERVDVEDFARCVVVFRAGQSAREAAG